MTAPMTPVHLFENHDEAYHIWRAAGIRGASIVHVDAHHDLAWLDDPLHLTIGNYLCQAIKDGIAAHIYWVVPDGALSTFLIRTGIVRQLRILRSAYPGLKRPLIRSARSITTELLGARIVVCELDALPRLDQPLLDVDTDFLMTPASIRRGGRPADEPWLSPRNCVSRLQDIARAARLVTIAYSVEGGYTPLQWKYLGDELAVRFRNPAPTRELRGFEQLTLAHECGKRGRIGEAERALADASPALANPAAAAFARGRLLARAGRLELARVAHRSAVASDPSYATAYNCDGRVALDRGRFDDAERAFSDMLALDDRDRYAHFGLGSVATHRRRWAEAERHTRAAMACGLDAPDAFRLLAEALERQGRRTEAVAALQHSLRVSLNGRASVAGAIVSRVPTALPVQDQGHARAYASLGRLEADLGLKQNAMAALRLAIAGGYRRPAVHARLARLYAANRRWREALSEAGRAFALLCSVVTRPRRSS